MSSADVAVSGDAAVGDFRAIGLAAAQVKMAKPFDDGVVWKDWWMESNDSEKARTADSQKLESAERSGVTRCAGGSSLSSLRSVPPQPQLPLNTPEGFSMNPRRFFRLLVLVAISGVSGVLSACSEDPSNCPSQPYSPGFGVMAFTRDSVVLDATVAFDCPQEGFDTTVLSATVSGRVELLDGTIDSVIDKPVTFRWRVVDGWIMGLRWNAPSDGIRKLLDAEIVVLTKGDRGSAVRFVASQPE